MKLCAQVFFFLSAELPLEILSVQRQSQYRHEYQYVTCYYKIARHHMIPTIMATTNPRIPMIMMASAPLVPILLSNIVILFKDHFMIVWSVSELSSVNSMRLGGAARGEKMLPCGDRLPKLVWKVYMRYRSLTSTG